MAIMDANYDQEMMRLWGIISDLSEQLNQHRATASALRNQAEGIKVSFRHRANIVRSEGPYAKCLSDLEPSNLQPNGFRVAQVWVCVPYLVSNCAHPMRVKVQYGQVTGFVRKKLWFDSIYIDRYPSKQRTMIRSWTG